MTYQELEQVVQDLQDTVDQQQQTIDDYENRLEALENPDQTSVDQFPLDPAIQAGIEQTLFQALLTTKLRAGIPIYTALRNTAQIAPMQGEIWLENISGVRKIVVWISGTAYKVTIT